MRGLALPRIGRISNRTRSYSRVPDFILAAGKRDRRTSSSSVWWRNRDQQQYSNLANNYLVFNFSLSNDNVEHGRILAANSYKFGRNSPTTLEPVASGPNKGTATMR